jgi:5-hydroxyisourate hydrolase-like protein (transthyretin family)
MYIPSGTNAELAFFSEGYFRGSHVITDKKVFKKKIHIFFALNLFSSNYHCFQDD